MSKEEKTEFEKATAEEGGGGFMADLFGFLKQSKKWWLIPLVVILIVLGLLIFLSSTGVAPFIYTLF